MPGSPPGPALPARGGCRVGQAWRRLRALARRLPARLSSDCPLCGARTRGGRLCAGCAADTRASLLDGPRCGRCALARPVPEHCGCPLADAPFEAAVAGFDYQPPADLLVLRFKNRQQLSLAGALTAMLAERVRQAPWAAQRGWQLVPVPSAEPSLARRGFNPAAELARRLGQELGWPVRHGWLQRARQAPLQGKQSRLGRRQRQLAARHAYRAVPAVAGAWVALVDDVMTTGSTASAAALALRQAGAARVVVLAAARTPQRSKAGSLAK